MKVVKKGPLDLKSFYLYIHVHFVWINYCVSVSYYDDPYFDYETFVNKNTSITNQDEDPDETGYELELESQESSDTDFT